MPSATDFLDTEEPTAPAGPTVNSFLDAPLNPLASTRAGFIQELDDPATVEKLYSLTHREVGNQGPAAQQAFVETVFNRAAARGATLAQTISDRNYYPGVSLRRVKLTPEIVDRYGPMVLGAAQGSNVSNLATGNASGTVGFAGGPQTFRAGGERFGIEGPDRRWARNIDEARRGIPVEQVDEVTRVEKAIPVKIRELQVARAVPVMPGAEVRPAIPRGTPVTPQGIVSVGGGEAAAPKLGSAESFLDTPEQPAAGLTDVGYGPGVAPPYPEGSPEELAARGARALMATEVPAETARQPTTQEAVAAGIPQFGQFARGAQPPLEAPPGEPTTVPEAYREAGGDIGGVINALHFASQQPIINEDQAHQIVSVLAGPARATFGTDHPEEQKGIEEQLTKTISGLTSPEGLAQAALLKNPVARALFVGDTVSKIPGDIKAIADAYKSGDKKELGRAIASASTNALMGAGLVGLEGRAIRRSGYFKTEVTGVGPPEFVPREAGPALPAGEAAAAPVAPFEALPARAGPALPTAEAPALEAPGARALPGAEPPILEGQLVPGAPAELPAPPAGPPRLPAPALLVTDTSIPANTRYQMQDQLAAMGHSREEIKALTTAQARERIAAVTPPAGEPTAAGELEPAMGAGDFLDAPAEVSGFQPRTARKPTKAELAEREHQAELLRQGQADIEAQGGMDLLEAVGHEGGLPGIGHRFAEPYRGELKNLRETIRGTKGVRFRDVFSTQPKGNVDDLLLRLRARGFDIETPHQLIDAIQERVRTGTPHYGLPEFGAVVNYARRAIDPVSGQRYSLADETRAAFKGTGQTTPALQRIAAGSRGPGGAIIKGPKPFLERVTPEAAYTTKAGPQIRKAEALAKTFATQIEWFRPDQPTDVNAATEGGTLHLNVDASGDPVHAVAAHELAHNLQKHNPKLHGELKLALAKQTGAGLADYTRERLARGYTPEQVSAELVSDFVGETLRDPARMAEAMGDNPGLARRLLTYIRDFLDRMLRKLGFRKDASATGAMRDIKAARAKVMETLQAYRKGRAPAEPPGPAQLARKRGAPAPRKGKHYIGDIDEFGEVRSEPWDREIERAHEYYGFDNSRWRYNPASNAVVWWDKPTEAQKAGVEAHLARKGIETPSHYDLMTSARISAPAQFARKRGAPPAGPELFAPKEMPFTLRGEELTQEVGAEGAARAKAEAEATARKEQDQFQFARKAKTKERSVAGHVIPRLTRAGVMDEAVQHAAARQYVPALVDNLISQVFPDKYTNPEAMRRSVEVIRDDNILGGYDEARRELARLQKENPNSQKTKDQAEAVRQIEKSQNIPALDRKVKASLGTDIATDARRWAQFVTPEMDKLYNELKSADPNTPRETRGRYYDARMNLLPKFREAQMADYSDPERPMPEINVSNYRNPNLKRDAFMRQAMLTGDYSDNIEPILTNSFGRRVNEATKLRLYKALESKGVGKIVEPGETGPDKLQGVETARMPVKVPETNPETGKTQMVERSLIIQKPLTGELRDVLNTDQRISHSKIARAVTQLQLFQLADATAHLKNIHSVIVNSLSGSSFGREVLRKVPMIGSARAVAQITQVARQVAGDKPAIRAELAQMAKHGMIRPQYPATGIQKITHMQQLIHQMDTASRILMNRWFTKLVDRGLAKDTIENRRNFVQQIGEYNRRLMPRAEAMLRDYGFSPFIVAGRTFNRYSRRLLTGHPGFETTSAKAGISARAAQLSGLLMAIAVPALINTVTTQTPFGRPGTEPGAIDFGEGFDTEDGKRRGLDLLQLTGFRRGLRGTGLNAIAKGLLEGQSASDMMGQAASDVLTTAAHPFVGPAAGAAFQALTGKRLDLRSGYAETFGARQIGGIGQYLENLRVSLKQQNPFLYGLAQKPIEAAFQAGGVPPASSDEPNAAGSVVSGLLKSPLSAVGYKEYSTPALAKAAQLNLKQPYTPEQDQRYALRRAIYEKLKEEPAEARALYLEGVANGTLTKADQQAIARREKEPDLLTNRVKQLDVKGALKVFGLATDEEKQKIYSVVRDKIKNSTAISPQDRADFNQTLSDLTASF